MKNERKVDGSLQKSILMKTQNKRNSSMEKGENKSLRKVHFDGQKQKSERKGQSANKNEEVEVQKNRSGIK